MAIQRTSVPDLQEMKRLGDKITLLTAYDCLLAGLIDEAQIDLILIGDSVGMVVLGYESTVPVTLEQMVHHTQAVVSTAHRPLIIADMPFGSFEPSDEEAIRSAQHLVKVGGAQAVKVEGGNDLVRRRIGAIVQAGVPVMSHLGLTPQTTTMLGGYRVQGREASAAQQILDHARSLQAEGIFSLLLECVPAEVARAVTAELHVPVIGIGAGAECDGQALVTQDLLGLYPALPRHARQFAQLRSTISEALAEFRSEVKAQRFPAEENTFHMKAQEAAKFSR
jgi:3-methyl-2-oxobutanoate hydroxymethyltransferase